MGQFDFAEPPWVYSPTEVMKWINATHPVHKVRKSHVTRKKEEKKLENIELSLDIDVEKTNIPPSHFFNEIIEKITGSATIEDHFEIIPTAELIARGLAKAKFHNMMKILLDGNIIYQHPENGHDLRKTIEMLTEMSHKTKQGKTIELVAKKDDNDSCIADIRIQRIHPKKVHAVDIRIKGEIEEYLFHEFLNYLRDHLSVVVSKD
jgi:hypothetical protein